jgi:hypothetical protein
MFKCCDECGESIDLAEYNDGCGVCLDCLAEFDDDIGLNVYRREAERALDESRRADAEDHNYRLDRIRQEWGI